MKIPHTELSKYEQMGRAALLPGMVHMLELMQEQIDDFRRQLEGLQTPQPKRRGRPPKSESADSNTARYGWPDDPEERKAEMRRRMAKRSQNAVSHPRDPGHPKHGEWLKNVSGAAKKRWKNMSASARKERLAKMLAARLEKNPPVVKMAVAS